MNLIKNFPEIHSFFNKDTFDSNQLNEFIDNIKSTYNEKQIQKSALELIKLELLKFIIDNENIPDSKEVKPSSVKLNNNKTTKPNNSKYYFINELKNKNIQEICSAIDIRTSYFITLLKQQNIIKVPKDNLNDIEIKKIRHIIVSKLERLERIKKEEKRLQRKRTKKTVRSLNVDKETVYSKISNNRGVGKMIYIRKK